MAKKINLRCCILWMGYEYLLLWIFVRSKLFGGPGVRHYTQDFSRTIKRIDLNYEKLSYWVKPRDGKVKGWCGMGKADECVYHQWLQKNGKYKVRLSPTSGDSPEYNEWVRRILKDSRRNID